MSKGQGEIAVEVDNAGTGAVAIMYGLFFSFVMLVMFKVSDTSLKTGFGLIVVLPVAAVLACCVFELLAKPLRRRFVLDPERETLRIEYRYACKTIVRCIPVTDVVAAGCDVVCPGDPECEAELPWIRLRSGLRLSIPTQCGAVRSIASALKIPFDHAVVEWIDRSSSASAPWLWNAEQWLNRPLRPDAAPTRALG